jgi:hypothetical protein
MWNCISTVLILSYDASKYLAKTWQERGAKVMKKLIPIKNKGQSIIIEA